ncbi:MAG TPA: tRNA (guanine-N7)-methyltransferase [Polyangiaceae bacterium]|nr:tRNA (guanine-N7)-methyltransferase [Polyangiaceae bacterium]
MCPQLEAPAEGSRSRSPYASAPRLPQGEALDLQQVLGASPSRDAALASGLELEIGPGRGSFLLERLAVGPEVRIVGLEIRLKWASLVDQRLHELGLAERGRVFAEDIRQALPRFATGSLSRVFVHFPDPWWKKKHAKRRLANGAVVTEIARLLRGAGELFVQTDVWETAEAYRDAIESHPAFEPLGDAPGSALVVDNPYGARSPRERRVMADDLPVTRLRYRRRAVADNDLQHRDLQDRVA